MSTTKTVLDASSASVDDGLEEDQGSGATVLTFYGKKGDGKTTTALGLSGKKYVLSFDGKTQRVKKNQYNNSPDIVVIDAMKHFDETLSKMPASGQRTYEYVLDQLDRIAKRGDAQWVGIDYYPRMVKAFEMAMRYNNNLAAKAAFSNRSLWEERNAMLYKVHELAVKAAGPRVPGKLWGLFYVSYIGEEVLEKREGETYASKRKPKYAGYAEEKTDTIFYVEQSTTKDGKVEHLLHVETNKCHSKDAQGGLASVRSGEVIDLSDGVRINQVLPDL